jgi:hypothetical protein
MTRDSLAKALYCRTVATIVRRANSLKRLGSTSGTLSSDSNESVHNQAEVSHHLYDIEEVQQSQVSVCRSPVSTRLLSALLGQSRASRWRLLTAP